MKKTTKKTDTKRAKSVKVWVARDDAEPQFSSAHINEPDMDKNGRWFSECYRSPTLRFNQCFGLKPGELRRATLTLDPK